MLPPVDFRWRIVKPFQLAQSLRQLRRIIVRIDNRIPPTVIHNQRRREAVVTKTAAALPIHRPGNTALVFTVDDLLQTRNDMRMTMLAQFHHNPAPPHFVRDCAGSAGTGEGIKNKVAGVGSNVQNTLY